jgi:hypothetical protein
VGLSECRLLYGSSKLESVCCTGITVVIEPLWYVPLTCRQCLQLLERNVSERLGYKAGKNGNIRRHEFFSKLNWRQLEARRIEAPFKPNIVSALNSYQL